MARTTRTPAAPTTPAAAAPAAPDAPIPAPAAAAPPSTTTPAPAFEPPKQDAVPDPLVAPPETPDAPANPAPKDDPLASWNADEWDGETLDTVPEPGRPWIERARARWLKANEDGLNDLKQQKELFEQLIGDHGDPRVAELQKKIDDAENFKANAAKNMKLVLDRIAELDQAREAKESAERAEREAAEQAAADAYIQKFQKDNAWIFDNGENQHAAYGLMELGFAPEHLPELLKMPAVSREKASSLFTKMRADGVKDPGQYALDLARVGLTPPAPSADASVISGASAPNHGPAVASPTAADAPHREKLSRALDRRLAR
jgi:hypothetical protein